MGDGGSYSEKPVSDSTTDTVERPAVCRDGMRTPYDAIFDRENLVRKARRRNGTDVRP